MTKMVMYTGGLGPYCEVNGRTFPEKTVVEIEDRDLPAFHHRRKFVEVKGTIPLPRGHEPSKSAVVSNK